MNLNNSANSSVPGIGAGSLVTDANSALTNGPQLQRSASINNEAYMRLPASPMSFSSINNISASSVMDGSSILQQGTHQEQMKQGVSSNGSVQAQKKPRRDSRQEDVLQQQVISQLLQRQESLQMQGHPNPQLNAFIQQQRFAQQRQQQQILQSLPHIQRASLMSQHLRPSHLQIQSVPPLVGRSSDNGVCARRLMQYMYHQRHRPPDNSILYWRKFVVEYFAPKAKKKWCLSLYENVGSQALGAFPQAAMDSWHCDICGSKCGKGFEATYEVLPRLSQIKFDCGIIDELLYLDMPCEFKLASGIIVLEYAKAIQESVYEQLRVVREGRLRLTFTPNLKILSWEFCARRHEEFFSRRAVAPQVNQLLQVAHKYQTAVNENGAAGVPLQDLQASCNMFTTTGRQLVRNLELHSLNDLGFSKRYVRCLQISEVVNGMKDLIDFSRENKIGPIESLKSYPRQAAAANLHAHNIQEVDQKINPQNLPTDQSTLNKIMANNTPHDAVAANNYQYLLQTASAPNNNQHQPSTFTNPKQAQPVPFLTKAESFSGSSSISFPQTSQPNQHLEQRMIQQLLQEMMNNKGGPQQSEEVVGPMVNGAVHGTSTAATSRSNSFKSPANNNNNNNNSSSSSSSFAEKPDVLPNLQLPDLDQDILREFAESGIQW